MQNATSPTQNVRCNFNHGLGDCAQFTIVLKHLKKYRPEWIIDTASPDGRYLCFRDLCQNHLALQSPRRNYDKIIDVTWAESHTRMEFSNLPMTKVTRSLLEQFKIEPDESLYEYHIKPNSSERNKVKQYISTLPYRQKIVGIHYRGTTSTHTKDLDHGLIEKLCKRLCENGITPIILDWNNTCKFTDNISVFCPNRDHFLWNGKRFADATMIAALIAKMDLFVGIDSGPLHVAGATETPSIGVWIRHHPMNFYDLCDNVHHLLRRESRSDIRGLNKMAAENYFQRRYRHTYYTNLEKALFGLVSEKLGIELLERDVTSSILTPNRWWTIKPIQS